jgi:hypothetical protein
MHLDGCDAHILCDSQFPLTSPAIAAHSVSDGEKNLGNSRPGWKMAVVVLQTNIRGKRIDHNLLKQALPFVFDVFFPRSQPRQSDRNCVCG